MDLSIIIVNYNTKKLIEDCIKSIKSSDTNYKYEVIVVDNGSDEKLHKTKDFKLIENSSNLGFAKANNQGIKASKGKYILLLNSDTKVNKKTLNSLIDFAENHPDAAAIVPKLLNLDGTSQGSVFKLPTIFRNIRQYWFGETKLLNKYAPDDTSKVESAVMAAFLITPLAKNKVGLLDEKYFMYFEDLEYCRRLKKAKLPIYYYAGAEVIHYHGESGKKLANSENQWKRLVPSSKIYHGTLAYYINLFIQWTGQKFSWMITPMLILLLTIPAFFNLLKVGFFPMQDDLQAFRIYEMDRCYSDFQIPCRWVPDMGYQYGYPQFNYYPPLPYYIGAGLHHLGIQYIDIVKILFVAGYILSAFSMFLLVSTLFKSKWTGFVASLLYTYIPYKAVEVFVRGALSEFWAQIFFPLILWSIYKLVRTGKTKYIFLTAFSIAFLITTHVLMTLIFIPIAILWGFYWLFISKWTNFKKLIFAGLLGFSISSFFALPVLFERGLIHTEGILSGYFDYRQHFVSLYKLFISTEWGYGSSGFPNEKLNLSLGIVQWVVGLILTPILALLTFNKNKKISMLALASTLVTFISIFMMHLKSSFIWAKIPTLWYLQFPWRFLAVSIFLLVLLSGFSLYFSGKYKYILGCLLVIVSFILNVSFFIPKSWMKINDSDKFSGESWEKQLTISIFDYLPKTAVLPPWQKAPNLPEVLDGEVKFVSYTKGSNWQSGDFISNGEARLRVPLLDFPGMAVKLDGKTIPHINNDCRNEKYCLGLVTFNVPSGSHSFVVKLENTFVRILGNTLSGLSLVGVIIYLILNSRIKSKK